MPFGEVPGLVVSILPFFSTPSVNFTPGSSIAFARSSAAMSAATICGESKYFGSGQKRTRVPVSRGADVADLLERLLHLAVVREHDAGGARRRA